MRLNGKKLKEGRDYTLAFANNVNAGMAKVTIKGEGNYRGKLTSGFRIAPISIAKASISALGTYTETGGAIKPSPTVTALGRTLSLGRDYNLSYSDNYEAGTAYVTISGVGNFGGSTVRSFKIVEPVLQTVYITRTGECYHRGDCYTLRWSKIPTSRSNAIASGYRACKICRP